MSKNPNVVEILPGEETFDQNLITLAGLAMMEGAASVELLQDDLANKGFEGDRIELLFDFALEEWR